MLTEPQKKEFLSLKVEIIDLNILTYNFFGKVKKLHEAFKNNGRSDLFMEYNALRYMENGLIMHLTNLDDKNSNFSFIKAQKLLNKTTNDQNLLKKLNVILKTYRREINYIKQEHRNKRIAHLNYVDDLKMDQFLGKQLLPLIAKANEIGDLIWGEQINYQFKLGSHEGVLNFRNETKKLTS
ncbi:hypothetical protein SAMN05192545_1282 [Maribacter dokdonensis]|uniref:HEPN AbiU2-like domain-containing protein n=1 Tax=Maribacter dokdonensis TaxID=320912 RepID=A0ABY0UAZ6_9FLAO|nr:hypothetical protein [Maribacter dokdonensis]SDS37329.1 hypothetical protein SAMN05192545_1282 [Maribacter dokdonensis]